MLLLKMHYVKRLPVAVNQAKLHGVGYESYPFGEGQNPKSLLPSLQNAIEQGMQCREFRPALRDFIPLKILLDNFCCLPPIKGLTEYIMVALADPAHYAKCRMQSK